MSLASAKAAVKTSLITLRNVQDEDYAAAIDDYLSAMETWISASRITLPIGSVVVTGTATTQNNPAPITVDQSLS